MQHVWTVRIRSRDPCVGADRDGGERSEGERGRSERRSILRQLIETAEVLDDQDPGPEQDRVDRPFIAIGSVDVD